MNKEGYEILRKFYEKTQNISPSERKKIEKIMGDGGTFGGAAWSYFKNKRYSPYKSTSMEPGAKRRSSPPRAQTAIPAIPKTLTTPVISTISTSRSPTTKSARSSPIKPTKPAKPANPVKHTRKKTPSKKKVTVKTPTRVPYAKELRPGIRTILFKTTKSD